MSEVSLTLGLEAELGQALLLYNIDNIVRRSGDQEMLSLLLSPHLLPALLDCPSTGVSLVSTLTRLLPLLSSSQLNTLLHNTCPARRDLQILFSVQQAENSEELVQLRRSVLELFIVACLSLVQRKVECGQYQTMFDRYVMKISERTVTNDDDDHLVTDQPLSCGYNHTLFRSHTGDLVRWGA